MSFSFTVRTSAPDYRSVLSGLGLKNVRLVEDEEPARSRRWDEDSVRHFYRPGKSTRGCEVSFENDEFSVRINTLASPEDYGLAFRYLTSVAELAGKKIRGEDGSMTSRHDLEDAYGPEWIQSENEGGLQVVRQMMVDQEYDSLQLVGCIRPFYVGPKLMAELEHEDSSLSFLDRFMKRFRYVQYVDADDRYYSANAMVVRKDDTGNEMRISAFTYDCDYLLPDVEWLMLVGHSKDAESLRIPIDILPKLLPGRCTRIDEKQMLVERVLQSEWSRLLRASEPYAVDD